MLALTIWNPWASLIVAGVKPYEFRRWRFSSRLIGQQIAIHAGARPVKRVELEDLHYRLHTTEAWTTGLKSEALPLLRRWLDDPGILPRSAIIGTATLGKPRGAFDVAAEFGGAVNDSDRHEHANFAWPMLEPKPLEPIAPAKGAQGFWQWRP